MTTEFCVFTSSSTFALLLYFWTSWKARLRPDLKDALSIVISALSLAGAIKVAVFAISQEGPEGRTLIETDLALGAALLAGTLSLTWFAIEWVVSTILRVRSSVSEEGDNNG